MSTKATIKGPLSLLLTVLLIFGTLTPLNAYAASPALSCCDNGLSNSEGNHWQAVYCTGKHDLREDKQTGSTNVSQDIVGSEIFASAYAQFGREYG